MPCLPLPVLTWAACPSLALVCLFIWAFLVACVSSLSGPGLSAIAAPLTRFSRLAYLNLSGNDLGRLVGEPRPIDQEDVDRRKALQLKVLFLTCVAMRKALRVALAPSISASRVAASDIEDDPLDLATNAVLLVLEPPRPIVAKPTPPDATKRERPQGLLGRLRYDVDSLILREDRTAQPSDQRAARRAERAADKDEGVSWGGFIYS